MDPALAGFRASTTRWPHRVVGGRSVQQAAPLLDSGGPTRQFRPRPSRLVPFRPVRPVRPSVPAESTGLRTLKTIPPSPVHRAGPGPALTWILSNHL